MLLRNEATYGIYYRHIMNLDIHCCYGQYFYSDKQQTTLLNKSALSVVKAPCTAWVVKTMFHHTF